MNNLPQLGLIVPDGENDSRLSRLVVAGSVRRKDLIWPRGIHCGNFAGEEGL